MPIQLITNTPAYIAEREAYLREKEEARKRNPFPSPRVISVPKPKPNALPSPAALPTPYSVKKILEEQRMRDIEEEDKKLSAAYSKKVDEESDKITNAYYAKKQKRVIRAFIKAAKNETKIQNVNRVKLQMDKKELEGRYIRLNYSEDDFKYVKRENAQYIMTDNNDLYDAREKTLKGRFDMNLMRVIPITSPVYFWNSKDDKPTLW